jgi:hypothetical protein
VARGDSGCKGCFLRKNDVGGGGRNTVRTDRAAVFF